MAAAINILFRGKYGWGFPVRGGAFAHAFLCLTVVFTQQPQPGSSIPLTMSAVGVLVSYAGGGSVALF